MGDEIYLLTAPSYITCTATAWIATIAWVVCDLYEKSVYFVPIYKFSGWVGIPATDQTKVKGKAVSGILIFSYIKLSFTYIYIYRTMINNLSNSAVDVGSLAFRIVYRMHNPRKLFCNPSVGVRFNIFILMTNCWGCFVSLVGVVVRGRTLLMPLLVLLHYQTTSFIH